MSGINLGLFCSTPAVALSRNILAKQAFDLLITGRFIDASTAVEYGLINREVPERELNDMVQYYATSICRKAANVVSLGKQLFYQQLEKNIDEAYPLAVDVMAKNMLEPDAIEGIDAFLQKRGPKWIVPDK